MMKARIAQRIAVAACLVAVAQSQPAGEVAAPPRMEIEKEVVELGDVVRGEVVVASFAIRNVGGETLRILKAKPG